MGKVKKTRNKKPKKTKKNDRSIRKHLKSKLKKKTAQKKLPKKKIVRKTKTSAKKKPAGKIKPKKIKTTRIEPIESEDLLAELIRRGKQRGFITEDEIIHLIPNVETEIEKLEELYEKMENSGVRVISSDEMLKMETDKVAEEYEGNKKKKKGILDAYLAEETESESADLVQMYLKEIGRVSLLNAEEEVNWPKPSKGEI